MADFAIQPKKLLQAAGCRVERHGKGDHDTWFSPFTRVV